MSEARRQLERRARNAILQEAFFRPRSAILWSLVLIIVTLFPAFWWLILPLGLGGWILNGIETMRNPAINARAVAHIFDRQFKPRKLNSKELSQKAGRSLEYLQQIEEAIHKTREGVLRDRLKRTADEVVDWVEMIYRLAGRIDTYRQDQIIARDMNTVPRTIHQLRRRLAEEDDSSVQEQLRQTIADREQQLANLEKLHNTMESAELQLERTLSALGTVYSQLLMVGSRSETGNRAERLQSEISEQVHQLQDLVEAMEEYHAT